MSYEKTGKIFKIMIDNPNPNNFYNEKEMAQRKEYITVLKKRVLDKLKDLSDKIEKEEPFPHGNISLDRLGDISDELDDILNGWNY